MMIENIMLIIFGIIVVLIITIIILGLLLSRQKKETEKVRVQAQSDISNAYTSCKNEKQILEQKHSEEIIFIKKNYESLIRQIREEIETQKEALSQMEEKELLINVMIALGGYAGRLERIEKQLKDDQIMEHVTHLFRDVLIRINDATENVIAQVKTTEHSIESTLNDFDTKCNIDSIGSDVEDIKTSVCDKFSYDSLASKIDDIKSEIYWIKSAADDAKNAAENARYAVESIKYTV